MKKIFYLLMVIPLFSACKEDCAFCDGTGKLDKILVDGAGDLYTAEVDCPECNGTGNKQ